MPAQFFRSASEFREWLEHNHRKAPAILLGFYKKQAEKPGITYQQALCFGWIDGVRKSIDQDSYMIRFSPRKLRSIWSAVNTKRVGELIKLGQMQPAASTHSGSDSHKTRIVTLTKKGSAHLMKIISPSFRPTRKLGTSFKPNLRVISGRPAGGS